MTQKIGNVGLPPGVRVGSFLDPQFGHRLRRLRSRKGRPDGVPLRRWPRFARLVYEWCLRNADQWPYVFGGGHGKQPGVPTGGGYDCSGIVDGGLHAGGILQRLGTIGTREIEQLWGSFGFGDWVTVWVANKIINGIKVEHVVFEFPRAPAHHRFFMAFHTNGPRAGFLNDFNTSGYTAKHKA